MQLLFDFLPVILFFATYKAYGIMAATAVAMGASVVVALWGWLRHRRLEPMQLLSAGIVVVFGGATLLLADERFIKAKPTVLYVVLAILFWGSARIGKKPLAARVFAALADGLPAAVLGRLNHWWVAFFLAMAVLNTVVAWHFSTDVWVNFKLFGLLGLTLVFVLAQGVYVSRHYREPGEPRGPAAPG
ncbi:MAG: septation protein A [Nitrospirota bacterium]|nr:septation protein A [Nitrospirota bacterium]